MKRILLSFVLLAVVMTAGAQSWEITSEKGDELKGTTDATKYRYEDADHRQAMAFYQPGDYWKVGIAGNVFQPDKAGRVVKRTLNMVGYATIGFYNENDVLIEKYDDCYVQLTQGLQVAEVVENIWGKTTKGARNVVLYLTNQRGYVRIIIPTARGKEFDMKVPCINNGQ